MKIAAIYALMLAGLGGLIALVFIPPIQQFTNSTSERMVTALNTSGFADTPFAPIMHSWNLITVFLIIVCVVIIFVGASRREG